MPVIATYIKGKSRNLGEVRRLCGKYGHLQLSNKFSTYYKLPASGVQDVNKLKDDEFTKLAYELAQHVETGMNFLCVEASEILAFVAMHSEKSYSVGIPSHLPIAYGLKGNSLPMSVMRNIINDIRNDLKEKNTGVL